MKATLKYQLLRIYKSNLSYSCCKHIDLYWMFDFILFLGYSVLLKTGNVLTLCKTSIKIEQSWNESTVK